MKLVSKLALALGLCAALTGGAQAAQDKVNVFYYSLNDNFVNQLSAQLRASAEAQDLKLAEYDAVDDLSKQLRQVRAALAQGKTPLLVNPVDALNGEAVLRAAKRANVPVVFFNRKPSDQVLASYDKAYYVGSDPAASGVYQAEIMIDYLQHHPEADKNKNGQIDYVMIKGEPSHLDTQLRTSAFIRTMMDSGFAGEPLYSGNANWSYSRAIVEMQNALSTHRIDEIEAIICNNDAMALGVLNELQARGYNKGDSSKFIPLIGIDALPKAVEAVSRRQMIGTVYNDSQSMAEILVKMGKALNEGKEITEEVVDLPVVNRQIDIPYVKYSM